MNLLAPARCFDPNSPELLDRPEVDGALVREELELLENANSRFGGHRLAIEYVQKLLGNLQTSSLSILDLGTGLADVPRAIVAWLRNRKLAVSVTAVDCNPRILALAQEACRDWPEIHFEQHDMRALPYAAGSYDLVLCSLALHHFDSADVVQILRRIQEIARVAYTVNDLRRNWMAIWTTEILARTVIRSAIFRNDAPQSCRAAFTVDELRGMAEQAGLRNFQINRHHAVFRMVLEGRK